MNLALVLGLLLMCGTVLATEDYGFRETESKETEDELLRRELEKEFLILHEDPLVPCGDDTCKIGEICDKEDGNKCKCPDGKTGDGCTDFVVCTQNPELKKICEDIGAKCIQDSNKKDAPTCECTEPGQKFDGSQCAECTCGAEGAGKSCKFVEENKVCECNTGFSLKETDKLCHACDCGKDAGATCKFEGDNPVCNCSKGFSLKNDKLCHACYCGAEVAGKSCKFVEDNKVCECNTGFSLKETDKLCHACACGEDSGATCKFEGDIQVCSCSKGFSLKNDKLCYACTCGAEGAGKSCKFEEDNKVCECNTGFSLKETDKLCHACDCGEGTCSFDKNGNKQCACKAKYANKDGKCEACDCGEGTCSFDKDGNKQCACKAKYAHKDGKCEECDCGDKGTCGFDNDGNKKCNCNSKYAEKNGKCEECDCGEGTCSFDTEANKICVCKEKYEEKNGKCQVCDCGKNGKCSFDGDDKKCACNDKYEYFEEKGICQSCYCGAHGTCSFNKDGTKQCDCADGYAQKNDGECHETCDPKSSDCKHNGTCDFVVDKNNFCKCGQAFKGDWCESIVACVDGKFKKCEETGGKCILADNAIKAQCVCEDPKKLDENKNICRKKCRKDVEGDCKNTAPCVEDLCKCPEGTSGDDCSVVNGCDDTLTKKCDKGGATCVYDPANKAVCKCKDDVNFEFVVDKCVPKWCKDKPCKDTSNCTFSGGAGRCECKEGEYYDYSKGKCLDINKCPKTPCGENRVCVDGVCKCAPNYEEVSKDDKKECKRKKICKEKSSDPCYYDATCTEGDVLGSVKCECPSNFTYDPAAKKCEDGKCFLPGERNKCQTCPGKKLKKIDGNCVAIDDKEKCSSDCGEFGYCLKIGDKDTCVCVEKAKNENGADTKCVLDAKKVCASGKLQANQLKCDCSGIYKQSKNGITCELKTCGDDDAQKDCKDKGGFCKDVFVFGKSNGYTCACRPGYNLVDGKCIDACFAEKVIEKCSKQQKVCYKDEQGTAECKCPPGYTEKINGEKKTCEPIAQNAYLIQALPVQSERYKESNSFDAVKLNQDIIQSMKTIYKNLKFSSLQQYRTSDDGKVLLCDVWLQFDGDAKDTIKRWKTEAVEEEQSFILPPALYLNKDKLAGTKDEQLNFCSQTVSLMACGQGTKCADNKCSCDAGYRVIAPTVQEQGDRTILRCADIDECQENLHKCNKDNSKCVNKPGSYFCSCLPGFHRNGSESEESQAECFDLCTPNPCGSGECKVDDKYRVECSCKIGYTGSYCGQEDGALKKAQHSTTVVGAVLGTLLGVTLLAIVFYILRQRKNSYSEDFSPAPRDNAEMVERNRPLRGVSNRAYQ